MADNDFSWMPSDEVKAAAHLVYDYMRQNEVVQLCGLRLVDASEVISTPKFSWAALAELRKAGGY